MNLHKYKQNIRIRNKVLTEKSNKDCLCEL